MNNQNFDNSPETPLRYGFGENWAEFIDESLSDQAIFDTRNHLLQFLGRHDLEGKSFLDIGSGSGLHSLAALQAGAERIHSFDYDENSVATTRRLWEGAGRPAHWKVEQGSALEASYLESLGKFDIVYSWGVLHHTGAMWEAIRNASIPIAEDGLFYIALYCADMYHFPETADYWLRIKQEYNKASNWKKKRMEWSYFWRKELFPAMKRLRPDRAFARLSERRSRGMTYWTDVKDWLGGWPMEFAGIQETVEFCDAELSLELLRTVHGEACSEYLFRQKGARNSWDDYFDTLAPLKKLKGGYKPVGEMGWEVEVESGMGTADSSEATKASQLMIYEDGIMTGFAHAPHSDIKRYGRGRFSHWGDRVMFSSSDGTNPCTNGRKYEWRLM